MTVKEDIAREGHLGEPIEALPNEDALTTAKRVNVKYMNLLRYRGVPYFKFVAVNNKKGYAYDLNKGMYPTREAMWEAFESDRDRQRDLDTIEEAHADSTADNYEG